MLVLLDFAFEALLFQNTLKLFLFVKSHNSAIASQALEMKCSKNSVWVKIKNQKQVNLQNIHLKRHIHVQFSRTFNYVFFMAINGTKNMLKIFIKTQA